MHLRGVGEAGSGTLADWWLVGIAGRYIVRALQDLEESTMNSKLGLALRSSRGMTIVAVGLGLAVLGACSNDSDDGGGGGLIDGLTKELPQGPQQGREQGGGSGNEQGSEGRGLPPGPSDSTFDPDTFDNTFELPTLNTDMPGTDPRLGVDPSITLPEDPNAVNDDETTIDSNSATLFHSERSVAMGDFYADEQLTGTFFYHKQCLLFDTGSEVVIPVFTRDTVQLSPESIMYYDMELDMAQPWKIWAHRRSDEADFLGPAECLELGTTQYDIIDLYPEAAF